MPRWESGTHECMVGNDGVFFDMLGYQPLDMDWSCSLEAFLTDPSYQDFLRNSGFPPGTAEEARAAVIAELTKLGRPIPEPKPPKPLPAPAPRAEPVAVRAAAPPAEPFVLAFGVGDDAAFAFAQLVARVGQAAGLGTTVAGPIAWDAPRRVEEHGPMFLLARLGGLVITRAHSVSDGIGGPQDVFEEFQVAGTGISATWNGNVALKVKVKAPTDRHGAVRAVLGEPHVVFEPL